MSLKNDADYLTQDSEEENSPSVSTARTSNKKPTSVMGNSKGEFWIPTPPSSSSSSSDEDDKSDKEEKIDKKWTPPTTKKTKKKRKFSSAFTQDEDAPAVKKKPMQSVSWDRKMETPAPRFGKPQEHSWKNSAHKNKSESKKRPVVKSVNKSKTLSKSINKSKTPSKKEPVEKKQESTDDDSEVEIVAPPKGYQPVKVKSKKPMLVDFKANDPKKKNNAVKALQEDSSDSDSDDSVLQHLIFSRPSDKFRHRKMSERAEKARKKITVNVPGLAWRQMLDAHTGTSRELSKVSSEVSRMNGEVSKMNKKLEEAMKMLGAVPSNTSTDIVNKTSRALRDVGEALNTVTMTVETRIDRMETRVMTKMKDSTTDLKRHTTQKCNSMDASTTTTSTSTSSGRSRDSLPTNAGSLTSTEHVLERMDSQDGILNHMDGQIDWLLEMVQGIQAKCPDHSGKGGKSGPPSSISEGSSQDGTGTYTRNQREQERRRNSTGGSGGAAGGNRYVSMTVNQYSRNAGVAGTPFQKAPPSVAPYSAPAASAPYAPPAFSFKRVSEVVPFQGAQLTQSMPVKTTTAGAFNGGMTQLGQDNNKENGENSGPSTEATYRVDV
ncbi:unknown protein [Seminavis robusta]|uniref:Uncharacterized protein n=1 Tax=Seminavis robusta TaxID=568900 RepID=A0A9N8EY66_9STRA|nr:unknown protein [Seminavis robusta]|eukprot:Sro2054_g312740.1 n/a (605) ;mRNA; f:6596-8410